MLGISNDIQYFTDQDECFKGSFTASNKPKTNALVMVNNDQLRDMFEKDVSLEAIQNPFGWAPISDYLRLVTENALTTTISWYTYATDSVAVDVTGLTDDGKMVYD